MGVGSLKMEESMVFYRAHVLFGDRELKFRTDAMNFDPSSLTQKSPKKSWKKGNSTPRSENSAENSQDKPELLQLVLSEPDIQFYNIVSEKSEILFYIIASDGLWDFYSSKKCVQMVVTLIADGTPLSEIAEKLCEKAFRAGSKDDISVIVVVPNKERLDTIITNNAKKSKLKKSQQQKQPKKEKAQEEEGDDEDIEEAEEEAEEEEAEAEAEAKA